MNPEMEEIINLVKVQLGKRQISPEDRFVEDLGAESMDLLNIVASVEEKFKIELDEAKVVRIRSVNELYEAVKAGGA